MATSINSYSIKLSMDASGFVDATKVSRSEARQLIREIEGAQDPMEKFAVQQARWQKQLESGAISQGVYNRLIAANTPAVEAATISMTPYIAALGTVTVGLTAAAAAGVRFTQWITSVQDDIDKAADRAKRLGISFSDLKSLEFGFGRAGGVEAGAVGEAVKKLQISIAKAVDGDQSLRDSFAKLGLDAGQLIADGPKEAILKTADGMQKIASHAERMKLAMELFGKSGADLASSLGEGRDALASSVDHADHWLSLTGQQVEMVGASIDAWEDVLIVVTGISQKLASEMAPAMQLIAEKALGVSEGMGNVDQYLKNSVSNAVIMAGVLKDTGEYLASIGAGVVTGGMVDFGDQKFDTALKWYKDLEAKRDEAIKTAQKARRAEQQSAVLEDTEKEVKAKEDAAKKVANEEKRLREAAERESRKAAEDALKNAEKYFEDERKRQMKLREDVANGPGAGMEAGSAEAARFMAEQANQAIAEATVGVDAKPTDEQLVEQAKIHVEIARAAKVKQDEMVSKLQGLTDAVKDNGWEAV